MELMRCRLCGNVYRSLSEADHRVCTPCRHRLEDIYGRVHEYLRDNEDEYFDIYKLAEAMDISTADIQALVDLGYLERDLQTYGRGRTTEREKLLNEFNNELSKMKKTPASYGGTIYARDKGKKYDTRHYVYDTQKNKK